MTKSYRTQLLAKGFSFLEGPRWRDGHLWASDMRAGAVLRLDRNGAAERVVDVSSWPSGLGFLPDGSMLVVGMNDRRVYRIADGQLALYRDLGDLVSAPLNDMLVTPQGRAYVGDIGHDFYANEPAAPGNITLIDTDGSARRVASGLSTPNGMIMRPGGTHLCVAESFGHRVLEFECDGKGDLADRRVLIELPGEVPDGICLDIEGNIWVSCYLGSRFVQVDPNGRILAEIAVPGRNAVACQLGGSDGRTLFCLTYTGTFEQMTAGYPASQIEAVRVEIPAAGSP